MTEKNALRHYQGNLRYNCFVSSHILPNNKKNLSLKFPPHPLLLIFERRKFLSSCRGPNSADGLSVHSTIPALIINFSNGPEAI